MVENSLYCLPVALSAGRLSLPSHGVLENGLYTLQLLAKLLLEGLD